MGEGDPGCGFLVREGYSPANFLGMFWTQSFHTLAKPPMGSLGARTLSLEPVLEKLTSVCLPRYSPSTSMGTSRSATTLNSAAWTYSTEDVTRSRTPAMPLRVSTTNL